MLIVMYLEYKSVELTSDLSSHAGPGAPAAARALRREEASADGGGPVPGLRVCDARAGAVLELDATAGGVEGTLCELSCLSVLV